MNEFDLQGWEREIQAWRRRLDSQDAPVVRAELNDIARDIGELRIHPETEAQARDRVERRLVRLLALYDLARGRRDHRAPTGAPGGARRDRALAPRSRDGCAARRCRARCRSARRAPLEHLANPACAATPGSPAPILVDRTRSWAARFTARSVRPPSGRMCTAPPRDGGNGRTRRRRGRATLARGAAQARALHWIKIVRLFHPLRW